MGPIWGRQNQGGPNDGSINFAIWGPWHYLHAVIYVDTKPDKCADFNGPCQYNLNDEGILFIKHRLWNNSDGIAACLITINIGKTTCALYVIIGKKSRGIWRIVHRWHTHVLVINTYVLVITVIASLDMDLIVRYTRTIPRAMFNSFYNETRWNRYVILRPPCAAIFLSRIFSEN